MFIQTARHNVITKFNDKVIKIPDISGVLDNWLSKWISM